MFRRILFSVVFAVAVAPSPEATIAGVVPVPVPAPVMAGPLSLTAGRTQQPATAPRSGSQTLRVEVQGRALSLSVVRAGSTGLAVLSAPAHSVIGNLPDMTPADFQTIAARESGCSVSGEVQVLGSDRGTVALATGLSCS
jgi:hypothetical protein